MTPDRALRLAAEPVPLPERRLELIPALSTASRIIRDHGIAPQAHGEAGSHELRLPGIGGRYLAGIAAHVAARGWPAAEAGALVAALEDRCAMWIVCSSGAALVRAAWHRKGRTRVGRLRPVSTAAGGAGFGFRLSRRSQT